MAARRRTDESTRAYNGAMRRRKRGKRKLLRFFMLLLLLALGIGVALCLTVFFKAETIRVEGSSHYTEQQLLQSSGLAVGDNLLRMKEQKVEQQLIKQFPYIEGVQLVRSLPDTVVLKVTEATVYTYLEQGDGRFLAVSEQGRILQDDYIALPQGVPRVLGFETQTLAVGQALFYDPLPEIKDETIEARALREEKNRAEQQRFAVLLELLKNIEEKQLEHWDVLDLRDLLQLRCLYDGRVSIELGSSLELEYKMRAAAKIIETAVEKSTVGALDVSARPMMRLREYDIYEPEEWPYPEALREDYERALPSRHPTQWEFEEESTTPEQNKNA